MLRATLKSLFAHKLRMGMSAFAIVLGVAFVAGTLIFTDTLSKTFNDLFGNIQWTDTDRVHKLITEEIPDRVSADQAYQNARQHSDKQNARIEHDKALGRVMTNMLKDETRLFKEFSDNPDFKKWLADQVFGLTYGASAATPPPPVP